MTNIETFKNFLKILEESPLGFIKGECRLVSHAPNEFPTFHGEFDSPEDEEFFVINPPIISFSYKDTFLGEIKILKEYLEKCDFEEEKNCNLTLDIREGENNFWIYIKCPASGAFPYLYEFGDYLAFTKYKK